MVAGTYVLTVGVAWRARVPVVQASLLEPEVLGLVVDTCNEGPEVDLLEEDDEAVRVAVVSTRTFGGSGSGDCQDLLEVHLNASLDERLVVDAISGDLLTVESR
ncbi:hypothetical protein GCG21_14965 [Pseudactinotalea sp. HY160]|uniref:hypothetical protein n=1 Tax=Pseudactinotalea sp. HY160 TaxID=2654490 RepID=UPI00128B8842|nr:hypothetical protein [Pseudactinotalea sp. HY160]MPV51284.1 hypothetical protein [Pseudactinotalea sp. HY160]